MDLRRALNLIHKADEPLQHLGVDGVLDLGSVEQHVEDAVLEAGDDDTHGQFLLWQTRRTDAVRLRLDRGGGVGALAEIASQALLTARLVEVHLAWLELGPLGTCVTVVVRSVRKSEASGLPQVRIPLLCARHRFGRKLRELSTYRPNLFLQASSGKTPLIRPRFTASTALIASTTPLTT